MGFSLPKPHLPSSLAKIVAKPNLAKLVPALAVIAPVAYEVVAHPDKVKSTLGDIADGAKKAAPVVASTLGKGAHAVAGVAPSGFNAVMMPLMVVRGLVLAIIVLKK